MAVTVLLICFGLIGNISAAIFAFYFLMSLQGIWYGYALASFCWAFIFIFVLSGASLIPAKIWGIRTNAPAVDWIQEKDRALERITLEIGVKSDEIDI